MTLVLAAVPIQATTELAPMLVGFFANTPHERDREIWEKLITSTPRASDLQEIDPSEMHESLKLLTETITELYRLRNPDEKARLKACLVEATERYIESQKSTIEYCLENPEYNLKKRNGSLYTKADHDAVFAGLDNLKETLACF